MSWRDNAWEPAQPNYSQCVAASCNEEPQLHVQNPRSLGSLGAAVKLRCGCADHGCTRLRLLAGAPSPCWCLTGCDLTAGSNAQAPYSAWAALSAFSHPHNEWAWSAGTF